MDAQSCARVALACDESSRGPLAEALRADGYDVSEAQDETALLALVANVRPELVVVDLDMPQLSGLAVVDRLRETSARLRVILLTAAPSRNVRDAALARGAAALFPKPVAVDDLRTAVWNLARLRPGAGARIAAESAAEAALRHCIYVLRDVAAGRADAPMGASALHVLRCTLSAESSATPEHHHAAEVLRRALARFEDELRRGNVMPARNALELAALSAFDASVQPRR